MRNKYVLLTAACLLWAGTLLAQTPDTLRKKLDLVFQPLNKSIIPTGYLVEYGYPLIPADLFNNILTDSSRTNMQVMR